MLLLLTLKFRDFSALPHDYSSVLSIGQPYLLLTLINFTEFSHFNNRFCLPVFFKMAPVSDTESWELQPAPQKRMHNFSLQCILYIFSCRRYLTSHWLTHIDKVNNFHWLDTYGGAVVSLPWLVPKLVSAPWHHDASLPGSSAMLRKEKDLQCSCSPALVSVLGWLPDLTSVVLGKQVLPATSASAVDSAVFSLTPWLYSVSTLLTRYVQLF